MDHRAPIYITFMLACFYSADPEAELGSDHWNSKAGRKTRDWLVRKGLVKIPGFIPTDRGKAWVKYLCDTPLPKCCWILPERSSD